MTPEEIIAAIGLVGIGGILKSGIDFLIERKKRLNETKHSFKETRYKTILLLLYSIFNHEREKFQIDKHRPDIKSREDLLNEIKAEWTNMILFASDNAISKMRIFIGEQNEKNYTETLLAIRKDLYGLSTSLKNTDLGI